MSSIEKAFNLIAAEPAHNEVIGEQFLIALAMAETWHRKVPSDLLPFLPDDLPTVCDELTSLRIKNEMLKFLEKCPVHSLAGLACRILALVSDPVDQVFLVSKLHTAFLQGNSDTSYQIAIILDRLNCDVFRDEAGNRVGSLASCEAEKNMGMIRRFLERKGMLKEVS